MDNMQIYNAYRSVPQEAQKPIQAGRLKGMTDINPMWRIKSLTEAFGPCGIGWYTETTKQWTEPGNEGQVMAFCNLLLYVKVDGEWSKGIEGTGGSTLIAKERNGLYSSDEAYKMAYTDALSVACKSLGFAADIYYAKDRTKYNANDNVHQGNLSMTEDEIKQEIGQLCSAIALKFNTTENAVKFNACKQLNVRGETAEELFRILEFMRVWNNQPVREVTQ